MRCLYYSVFLFAMFSAFTPQLQTAIVSYCEPVYEDQLPNGFKGTFYFVPDSSSGPTVLRRISQHEQIDYVIPDGLQDLFNLRRPVISSDGQFVALRPVQDESQIIVWNLITDAVSYIQLDQDAAALLRGDNLSRTDREGRAFNSLFFWRDTSTLVIQTFDRNIPYYLLPISEQLIHLSNDGFKVDLPKLIQGESAAPSIARHSDTVPIIKTSPNSRYRLVMGSIKGSKTLDVVDAQTGQILFEDQSSFERKISGEAVWLADGRYIFYLEIVQGQGFQYVFLDAEAGFIRNDDLESQLTQYFGYPISDSGLPYAVSSDTNQIALMVGVKKPDQPAEHLDRHLIVYDVLKNQITTICVERPTVNYVLANSMWLSNDQVVGIRFNSLTLFEVSTGNRYFFDGYVIGIVDE